MLHARPGSCNARSAVVATPTRVRFVLIRVRFQQVPPRAAAAPSGARFRRPLRPAVVTGAPLSSWANARLLANPRKRTAEWTSMSHTHPLGQPFRCKKSWHARAARRHRRRFRETAVANMAIGRGQ